MEMPMTNVQQISDRLRNKREIYRLLQAGGRCVPPLIQQVNRKNITEIILGKKVS